MNTVQKEDSKLLAIMQEAMRIALESMGEEVKNLSLFSDDLFETLTKAQHDAKDRN